MYICYKIITYLLYPLAPIYLVFRKLRKKEDHIRYKEKLSKISKTRNKGILVWFHVASVGEAMSILPLIENFVEDKKIDNILVTSITVSSGKILEKKYEKNLKVFHQFLPLDIPILTNKFLNHWKPNLSIFVDSEIWPNLIYQVNEKKIPLVLVNARITKKSYQRWMFFKKFSKTIFSKFDLCIASNREAEQFLKNLGADNVKNYGNLKFSNIKSDFNYDLNPTLLEKIKNRKIWCAASTHPTEEIFCAKTHMEIKKKYSNVLTIIIPRHIDRTKTIIKELTNLNLKVSCYSQQEQVDEKTDILLVDAYGEASKFYNLSKSVFVGKSLIKSLIMDSGQNPIEPARLGCKIFHGPNISNFVEIYEYLKKLNITKEINTCDELGISVVEEFKENKANNSKIKEKIKNYGQNIFNNVIIELKKYI